MLPFNVPAGRCDCLTLKKREYRDFILCVLYIFPNLIEYMNVCCYLSQYTFPLKLIKTNVQYVFWTWSTVYIWKVICFLSFFSSQYHRPLLLRMSSMCMAMFLDWNNHHFTDLDWENMDLKTGMNLSHLLPSVLQQSSATQRECTITWGIGATLTSTLKWSRLSK